MKNEELRENRFLLSRSPLKRKTGLSFVSGRGFISE